MIYFDHAATTPMSKTARDVYSRVAEQYFGNPSSLHDAGSEAERVLESSRKIIAGLLQVNERGLYITGSGSEASFLSIVSLAKAHMSSGNHIITSSAEHSCVKNSCNWLENHGFEVTRLNVDQNGSVSTDALKKAIKPNTILASIQHANSEMGGVNDMEVIGSFLDDHNIIFHSDCVQTFCKLPINIEAWKLDAVSVSAHKINGPKGIGAAWVSPSLNWEPFLPGTTHEKRFRPGTVDVPAVASFAAAAKEKHGLMDQYSSKMERLRTLFLEELDDLTGSELFVEESESHQLPNIIGLRIANIEGQYAMLECSQKGLGISTGSACRVNEQNPSPTLLAMGYSEPEARQFVRCSFGMENSDREMVEAAKILRSVILKHSKMIAR